MSLHYFAGETDPAIKALEARRIQYYNTKSEADRLQKDLDVLTAQYNARKADIECYIKACKLTVDKLKAEFEA